MRQKKHPSPGSAETFRGISAPALARATFSLGLMRETWTLLLQHVERVFACRSLRCVRGWPSRAGGYLRRRHTYGTIVVDLEQHTVDVLDQHSTLPFWSSPAGRAQCY